MPISNDISLAQILGPGQPGQPGQLSDQSQLRVNDSGNIYSNSYKSTGFLSSVASRIGFAFVARFFSPTTRNDFRAANERLAELIKASYSDKAEESFKTSFSSHLYWGKPLTVGSVKKFLATYKAPEINKGNMAAFYGPKMASDYKRLFQHGDFEETTSSDLSTQFSATGSPAKETKTLLSPDVKSLSDMGYMTDADSNPDMLIPSGCAQILGSTARAQLLEQALYEPESRRKELESLRSETARAAEETLTRATALREFITGPRASELSLDGVSRLDIGEEADNTRARADTLTAQERTLLDVDSWPPKKLAAYSQLHAFVNEARSAPQKKRDEITKLEEQLVKLRKKQTVSSQADGKLSTDIADLEEKIRTGHVEVGKLKTSCSTILTDSQNWESWPATKQLQFVHKNRDTMDPISFDRIKLKVNGQFLPCSDSQSFDENFSIFKEALQQLNPGLAVTEDHFHELISLCDRNKTTAGTPSGAYNAEDHLPAFGQAASLIPTEINFYEIKLSPDSKSFDFHFDSGRCLLNSITFNGGTQDHLTPNFLYAKGEISVSGQAASLPADFLILERQCKFTWRYTPIAEEEGGNMGFGSLDLVDSRQRFCPLERKHAAALDARTQPFVNKARSAFETTINTPDPASTDSYSATTHVWLGDIQDGPAISDAFYKDLSSGSDKRGVCFLETTPREAPSRLYQKGISSDSLSVAETLQFEKAEESKMATACQKFVAFVGDKDQALAISRYATQHVSPQILIHELGEAGVLVLPPYGKGETSGNLDYKFTFSKSVKGETVMEVSCEQKPKCFNISLKLIELTTDSYLDLNYKITFRFEAGKPQPLLEVSDVNYNYSLEETKSPKFS